jgi:site-specific recombinase XerD
MFNQSESQQAATSNDLQHLSPDELLDVLTIAREHSIRDWCLILVGYTYGLRASEAVSIKLFDLDWQSEMLTVARKKGSLRTVQPIRRHRGRPLLSMFNAFKEVIKSRKADGSDYLFLSQKGGQLRPETACHLMVRYCELASAERIRRGQQPIAKSCHNFKVLKHTLGTCLAESRADAFEIKMRLGHRSFSSTQVYVHASQKQAGQATDRMMMELF